MRKVCYIIIMEVDIMRFESFSHLLSHWADAAPDAPALRYGERTLSHAALWEAVQARARALRGTGRTCLGIFPDGSADCVIELLAANIAGMQTVLLDDSLPDEALTSLLRYTDADLLWGDAELCDALSTALTEGVEDGAGRILFFTSGTTERSKAVVLTDRSLCQSAYNGSAMLPLSPEDTLLCILPLNHVFGFVCGLLWGLSCGACVALGRGPRHYADDCGYYRPTALSAVPALLGFLMKTNALNPELSLVLVGAGDCPAALLDGVRALGVRVSFGYGLTEVSSGVAISTGGDPFAMDVCPDDTITLAEDGEVLIEAPTCVMQGYYKRPEDTARALEGGVLHTGDLGRFDENGRLHITGRKKDVLVLADGTKLFLPEYEAALMGALGHTELAVILRDGRPVLVFSGTGDLDAVTQALRPVMAGLPRGQQLAGVILTDAPLPRTATGKIKRWELQQKAGQL